jgi:hypothetical protein
MSRKPDDALPPYGRAVSAGLFTAGGLALAVNHFLTGPPTVARLLLLLFGPVGLFLGAGGLAEPKVVWAVGKYGKDLPGVYKLIGGALAVAGVATTILLVFLVYPLGPLR